MIWIETGEEVGGKRALVYEGSTQVVSVLHPPAYEKVKRA